MAEWRPCPDDRDYVYVQNSIGTQVHRDFLPIIEDYHEHPERGPLLQRFNEWCDERLEAELAASAPATATAAAAEQPARPPNRLVYQEDTPGGTPIVEGSIVVDSSRFVDAITCRGYLVAMSAENDFAVVVFDIAGMGMIPCLTPSSIIDEKAVEAYQTSSKEKGFSDKRSEMHNRSTRMMEITSSRAKSDDDDDDDIVHGHLLLNGPKNFKGRVVDDCMLKCLEVGCIREGEHAAQTYYTLDRPWYLDEKQLGDTARLLLDTSDGILLSPTGKREREILVAIGQSTIKSCLHYHQTVMQAIVKMSKACELEQPEIDDIVLQISLGGDRSKLTMGKFLPCKMLRSNPDITIRCACGFAADDQKKGKGLLKRRCQETLQKRQKQQKK